MVRKQVYIEAAQESMLKRMASELGVAEAELIRQGIGLVMESGAVSTADAPAPETPWDDEAWAEALAFMKRVGKRGATPGGRGWHREELHERGDDDR